MKLGFIFRFDKNHPLKDWRKMKEDDIKKRKKRWSRSDAVGIIISLFDIALFTS